MTDARDCLLCGACGPFPLLFEAEPYALVRCRCGLVFQDPQPDRATLARAYYHDESFSKALLAELRPITQRNAREKLRLLGDAIRPGMRVLDVGASSGAWLELAERHGARATGVEIGMATAAAARERGLDVRSGTLEQVFPEIAGERFDLITYWDVLEHLADPVGELELAQQLLAPGGRIAATFPNIEGLYPRLSYRLFGHRTGVWEYPELPVHLYDFSPGTAARLLERAGYELERTRTFAIPFGFYRATSLSRRRVGGGRRGRLLRAAFELLRVVIYPIARLIDRGNAQFVLARQRATQAGPA